jgi:tRNA-Thr(GGU) m(6)t(6)A37 methyltransferase TsaA
MKPAPPKDYIGSVPFPSLVPLQPIGVVRSPYRERHGTPRQAVVTAGTQGEQAQPGRVELFEELVPAVALEGLAAFDYVWLICWLHLNKHWNPTVIPPRGPRVRRGVLATRAPHRPNQLGLSALRLVGVEGHVLHVLGLDLLDGTPVLDIKPYVPYADAFPEAKAGWLDTLGEPMDAPDRQG